jgi:hypothetical protein
MTKKLITSNLFKLASNYKLGIAVNVSNTFLIFLKTNFNAKIIQKIFE